MAPLAPIALAAGVGLMAAGQVQAGRAAEAEAKSAQNIANYNAAVMEQQAKAIEQKARFEQVRQAKAAERVSSRLKALLGVSGARIGEGTPLLLQAEQAAELELESLLIGFEARTEATRARTQATLDRLQGKLFRQRGKAAKQAGYIGAGATLLTGFGTAGGFGGGGGGFTKEGLATTLRY